MTFFNSLPFGFVSPSFLWILIPASAFLVYVYRKKDEARKILVASTLILRNFRSMPFATRKFVPPLRFFFELFLLTLLTLAASDLYVRKASNLEAVLIDNSFSMFAIPQGEGPGNTLLKRALLDADSVFRMLPSGRQIRLFTTAPHIAPVAPDPLSPSQASELLSSISPSFASDGLPTELEGLLQQPGWDRVRIFTDREVVHQNEMLIMEKIRPPVPLANVAVSGLFLREISAPELRRSIEATVTSFAPEPVSIRISVLPYQLSGQTLAPFQTLENENKLPAMATRNFTIEVPADDAIAYRLSLSLLDPRQKSELDSIREDDVGWIVRGESENTVYVVSTKGLRFGLESIPLVRTAPLTPATYSSTLPAASSQESYIFYKWAPEELPPANSLFILPPPGNPLFKTQALAASPQMSKWDASHPALNYLNLSALSVKESYPFDPPPWAPEILGSTAGPLIVGGEKDGHKYAAVGFEILPYEGRKSPLSSILLLNLVKWISNSQSVAGSQATGTTAPNAAELGGIRYLVTVPGLAPPETEVSNPVLSFPGIVETVSNDNRTSLLGVNFFNDEESNTLNLTPINLPPHHVDKNMQSESFTSYKRFLTFLVLAILLIDTAVHLRSLITRRRPV